MNPTPVVIEAQEAGSSLLLDALETYGCAQLRDALPLALLQAVARRANELFFRATYLQTSAELAALDGAQVTTLGAAPRAAGGTVADLVAALAASRPWQALGAVYPALAIAPAHSRLRLARTTDDPNAGFQQWAGTTRQRNLGFTLWIPLVAGEDAPGIELVARRTRRLMPAKDGLVAFADLAPEQRSALWIPSLALGDMLILDPFTLHRDAVRAGMRQARIAIECRLLRGPAES